MHSRQLEIAQALNVTPPFANEHALSLEVARRIAFIQSTLQGSGLKTLLLGISGGVDSSLAGRLAQLAVEGLRAQTGDHSYRFIAVRLPYQTQHDEADAQMALSFIGADKQRTVNIADGVQGLWQALTQLENLSPERADFVRGNIKARMRMLAQFAIANVEDALVLGTDHAAEAVMGFFTKFGDGACDLAPLAGLVKGQVRAMACHLRAPAALVYKTPSADLEELDPGKADEDFYGVSYAQIDAFLHGESVSTAVAERIIRAYEVSAHKRMLPITP